MSFGTCVLFGKRLIRANEEIDRDHNFNTISYYYLKRHIKTMFHNCITTLSVWITVLFCSQQFYAMENIFLMLWKTFFFFLCFQNLINIFSTKL